MLLKLLAWTFARLIADLSPAQQEDLQERFADLTTRVVEAAAAGVARGAHEGRTPARD